MPEFLHPSNWTVNESIKFLQKKDPSKPFFLKMSFARPHSPYDPPKWYYDHYENKALPEPSIGDWADIHEVWGDGKNPDAWHGSVTDEKVMQGRAGYYGSIHHLDHQIGRLIAYMQQNMGSEFKNTMFIFTSDHGDMLGDHNMWRNTYAYEGSARIPHIVKLPDSMQIKQKRYCEEPVTLYDIMPTILDVAGVPMPEKVDGMSMVLLTKGEEVKWRDVVHSEHCASYTSDEEMQCVTDGKYKYIWFPRTGREQFFKIENDRSESTDLINYEQYANEVSRYKNKLIGILSERNAGLTDSNGLVIQTGPIVSPEYAKRVGGD